MPYHGHREHGYGRRRGAGSRHGGGESIVDGGKVYYLFLGRATYCSIFFRRGARTNLATILIEGLCNHIRVCPLFQAPPKLTFFRPHTACSRLSIISFKLELSGYVAQTSSDAAFQCGHFYIWKPYKPTTSS